MADKDKNYGRPAYLRKGPKGFQKGKSGNPNGRPRIPEEIKNIKKLAKEELEQMITTLLYATDKEIKAILEDPNATRIQKIIAQVLEKTKESGNMGQFDMVLSRVIGKVKEHVEHTGLKPSILITTGGDTYTFAQLPIPKTEEPE